MCTSKAKSQLGHNRHRNAMRWQTEPPLPLEFMPHSAPSARVEESQTMTCAECRTIHYERALACRKCGAYLTPAERPAVVPILLVPSAAATAAAIVAIMATIALGMI